MEDVFKEQRRLRAELEKDQHAYFRLLFLMQELIRSHFLHRAKHTVVQVVSCRLELFVRRNCAVRKRCLRVADLCCRFDLKATAKCVYEPHVEPLLRFPARGSWGNVGDSGGGAVVKKRDSYSTGPESIRGFVYCVFFVV